MTLWAEQRAANPRTIDVRVNSGSVSLTVSEDAGHLRAFWGSLGRLLDTVESDQAAEVKA